MKQKLHRGFTLIELLVVIAIIGILASVVLASLNTARDKGTNAAIQASVNSIRAQAEITGQQSNGSVDYSTICTAIATIDSDIDSKNGSGGTICRDGSLDWAFEAQLVDSAGFICVDSEGYSTTSSSSVIGADSDGDRDCT